MEVRLSDEDVDRIAEAVVEKAMEDMGVRDIIIGSAMGEGAIPLYGRETRKEVCHACRIDPSKPLEAGNVMATTGSAIGTLAPDEVRDWCSEIIEVADGRCARARSIREAARECKEKYPEDTEAFFRCYIPAFSQATRESNPGAKGPWTCPKCGRLNEYYPYPTRCSRCGYLHTPEALPEVKEPWQMTKEEFINYIKTMPRSYREALIGGEGRGLVLEASQTGKSVHQLLVERAISEGKPVPPEVLADYPALMKGAK